MGIEHGHVIAIEHGLAASFPSRSQSLGHYSPQTPAMSRMSTTSSFLDNYESLDIIGNGSFGIIRKVKRKHDGAVSFSLEDVS